MTFHRYSPFREPHHRSWHTGSPRPVGRVVIAASSPDRLPSDLEFLYPSRLGFVGYGVPLMPLPTAAQLEQTWHKSPGPRTMVGNGGHCSFASLRGLFLTCMLPTCILFFVQVEIALYLLFVGRRAPLHRAYPGESPHDGNGRATVCTDAASSSRR